MISINTVSDNVLAAAPPIRSSVADMKSEAYAFETPEEEQQMQMHHEVPLTNELQQSTFSQPNYKISGAGDWAALDEKEQEETCKIKQHPKKLSEDEEWANWESAETNTQANPTTQEERQQQQQQPKISGQEEEDGSWATFE